MVLVPSLLHVAVPGGRLQVYLSLRRLLADVLLRPLQLGPHVELETRRCAVRVPLLPPLATASLLFPVVGQWFELPDHLSSAPRKVSLFPRTNRKAGPPCRVRARPVRLLPWSVPLRWDRVLLLLALLRDDNVTSPPKEFLRELEAGH